MPEDVLRVQSGCNSVPKRSKGMVCKTIIRRIAAFYPSVNYSLPATVRVDLAATIIMSTDGVLSLSMGR